MVAMACLVSERSMACFVLVECRLMFGCIDIETTTQAFYTTDTLRPLQCPLFAVLLWLLLSSKHACTLSERVCASICDFFISIDDFICSPSNVEDEVYGQPCWVPSASFNMMDEKR